MSNQENKFLDESNWVDENSEVSNISSVNEAKSEPGLKEQKKNVNHIQTIAMVEAAFLASTASLIWLIDYYLRFGPFLRMLFPLPIALVFLRRGQRASWMTTLVCGLLLSILMGPPRSIIFLIPYGLMGVQLGYCWSKGASWNISILISTIIGTFGLFFRFWLFSILLGEDLWVYVINQITAMADWIFLKLDILAQPSSSFISLLAIAIIVLNNIFYVFSVHLVALLMFDRLKNYIPRPPNWVKVILDYE